MIRVIIADDEILERNVYKVLLKRHFPDVLVVAEAETGRQAIELHDTHRPDLMLMDVKMPGINGIEAIEEIRRRHSDTRFIVISAYNFFDYAKEALKCGVDDYLLKPVAKDEFVTVFGNAVGKIKESKKNNMAELDLREKLSRIHPMLESEISFAFMTGDVSKIRQYAMMLDIRIVSGYVVIGRIVEESFRDVDDTEKNRMIQRVQDCIKENMTELKPCYISSFVAGRMIFIFPADTIGSNIGFKDNAYKKMLKVRNAIRDKFKIKMRFGISEPYKDISDIVNSYNQAFATVNSIDTTGMDIVHYLDVQSETISQFQYPFQMEKRLLEKVRQGIADEAMSVFVNIFDYITGYFKGDAGKVRRELLELHFALSRVVYELETEYLGLRDFAMRKHQYFNTTEIRELYRLFEEDIKHISGVLKAERYKRAEDIIFQAVQYIRENYMKELTLDDVAKTVCVSPNYFSRVFKNELNQSFIDYLTGLRVKAAEELIIKSRKSFSDVCSDVGYSDPNYFTKVFKKVTGLTPSEFRKNQENGSKAAI